MPSLTKIFSLTGVTLITFSSVVAAGSFHVMPIKVVDQISSQDTGKLMGYLVELHDICGCTRTFKEKIPESDNLDEKNDYTQDVCDGQVSLSLIGDDPLHDVPVGYTSADCSEGCMIADLTNHENVDCSV